MKISLVMATAKRPEETIRFLSHLSKQTHDNFELIIVDYNPDDWSELKSIVENYQEQFPIIYLQINEPGASRARNMGLQYVSGEIIGFPDDDCWYHSNLLADVEQYFFDQPELEGLIGRAVSEQGRTSLTRFGSYAKVVNCYDVWRCSATFTMFYRRHALPAIPVFNENLGVGASTPWGAAEDTQLLIDVLNNGSKVFYQPSLTIFHPDPFTYPRQVLHLRGYKYGCGMGYVMGINHYPRWFFNYYLLRSVVGIALALCSGKWNKLDHNLQTLKGRWYGWRTAHQELSR